jgi:hypothetical protein
MRQAAARRLRMPAALRPIGERRRPSRPAGPSAVKRPPTIAKRRKGGAKRVRAARQRR